MRIAVIQFPGSHGEREAMQAIERAGMEPVEFLWNEDSTKLSSMDGYVIVGGFSFHDQPRPGIIAALNPLMKELAVQSELGKPILGMGNGAQILVESGLVPGLENNKAAIALVENKRADNHAFDTQFLNEWVYVRLSDQYQRNAFTHHLTPQHVLHIPIASSAGRFVLPPALLQEVREHGLNVFQYCDANGLIDSAVTVNPIGSVDNIAAISNKAGNVLAMMPHIERTINGDAIFLSMRAYIEKGLCQKVEPLHYYPRRIPVTDYHKPSSAIECLLVSPRLDEQAKTVESTLRQHGFQITVRCYMHWEIESATTLDLDLVTKTGVLFDEDAVSFLPSRPLNSSARLFLVRAKDDWRGSAKTLRLQNMPELNNIRAVRFGIVWEFIFEQDIGDDGIIDKILATNIIHHPTAYDCYRYPCS